MQVLDSTASLPKGTIQPSNLIWLYFILFVEFENLKKDISNISLIVVLVKDTLVLVIFMNVIPLHYLNSC